MFALQILCTSGPGHSSRLHLWVLHSQVWKPSQNGSLFTDSKQGEDWSRVHQGPAFRWFQRAPACPCWTAIPPAQWFPVPTGNSVWPIVRLLYICCGFRGKLHILLASIGNVGSYLSRAGHRLSSSIRRVCENGERPPVPEITDFFLSKMSVNVKKLDGTLA